MVVGANLTLDIAPRATLTIYAQPVAQRQQLFTGGGSVRFMGEGPFLVFPEWWEQPGDVGQTPALRRMAAACAVARCTALLTKTLTLTGPWTITSNINICELGGRGRGGG